VFDPHWTQLEELEIAFRCVMNAAISLQQLFVDEELADSQVADAEAGVR
jgi:hypothetical protein